MTRDELVLHLYGITAGDDLDDALVDELLVAINKCQRDACKSKYQELCTALHQCECGKPQQYLAERRNANSQHSS